MTPRHLLSVSDLGLDGIDEVLRLADTFVEVGRRPIPRVPALRGKTVASVFFEDSTRTRLSFETAAKRLSADVMTFTSSSSSLNKGESLRDTVLTLEAMGVDAFVVRHSCAGVPAQVAGWLESAGGAGGGAGGPGGQAGSAASVLNAGDGAHEHPTQALLDCFTISRERERRFGHSPARPAVLSGLRIAIAYAKALAAAWKLPLVPLSSFDLLEFGSSFERSLTVVVGRPGVISARYRCEDKIKRASGRIAEVLNELLPASEVGLKSLDVVGASKDVLHALAERGSLVRSVNPAVTPAAAAAALAACSRTPPRSLHEVRADYGELPAAKVPLA